MFCECDIIQSFSVVCYVLRAVNKFNFSLVTDAKIKLRHTVIRTMILTRSIRFPPTAMPCRSTTFSRIKGSDFHGLLSFRMA